MAPEVAKAIQEAIYAKTIEREEAKEGRRGRTSRRLDCRPDCRWQRGAVHEDARRGPIPGPWGPYRDPYKGPRAPRPPHYMTPSPQCPILGQKPKCFKN